MTILSLIRTKFSRALTPADWHAPCCRANASSVWNYLAMLWRTTTVVITLLLSACAGPTVEEPTTAPETPTTAPAPTTTAATAATAATAPSTTTTAPPATTAASTTAPPATTTAPPATTTAPPATTTAPPATTTAPPATTAGCTLVGQDSLDYWEVSLAFTANQGAGDYVVEYALRDSGGARIDSDTAYIDSVISGETFRYADTAFNDNAGVTSCDVLSLVNSAPGEPSGAGMCATAEQDVFGFWETVVGFDADQGDGDYVVEYALRDSDGSRMYTATAYIDTVSNGETFQYNDTALFDLPDVASCDVLSVENSVSGAATGSGSCSLLGIEAFGFWEASLGFTADQGDGNYVIEYALRNTDGSRMYTATAYIDTVSNGETFQYDDMALFDVPGVASCDVLSVELN